MVVDQNTAFPKIAEIFADTPLETLKAWQAFHVADGAAPYLSKRFVDANFEFRGKTLCRPARAAPALEARRGLRRRRRSARRVGQLYVDALLPAGVQGQDGRPGRRHPHRAAGPDREAATGWAPETKAKALEKLAKFTVKIGYPDKWRDYSEPGDQGRRPLGNVERAVAFEWRLPASRG